MALRTSFMDCMTQPWRRPLHQAPKLSSPLVPSGPTETRSLHTGVVLKCSARACLSPHLPGPGPWLVRSNLSAPSMGFDILRGTGGVKEEGEEEEQEGKTKDKKSVSLITYAILQGLVG